MAKLTADIARTYELGDINSHPVLGNVEIFDGGAVGVTAAGFARPIASGDQFAGFAEGRVDSSDCGDGEKRVAVKTKGLIALETPSGVTQANVGAKLYASNDNTFTTTATGAACIGKIVRFSGAEITVAFEAFKD